MKPVTDPSNDDVLWERFSQCDRNDYETSAIEILKRLRKNNPDDSSIAICLAKRLIQAKLLFKAEACLRSISCVPAEKRWLVDLAWGDLNFWNRNFEAADSSYRKAITSKADSTVPYLYLARSLENQERFAESIELLTVAEQLPGDIDEIHYHKGLCYRAMEQYNQALIEFEKAIAIDPEYYEAKQYADDIRYLLTEIAKAG